MPARLKIFISSVQKEFEDVRRDLKSFLLGDSLLRRFISDVFLFEDLPASDRRVDQVYLREVERCDIYLGIFGNEYGSINSDGISPTEEEFNHATHHNKTRLIYVWGADDSQRSTEMKRLIRRASSELIRRRVDNTSALTSEVYTSLVEHLDSIGLLHIPPFDAAICEQATIKNLSRERISWFLNTVRNERNFPLKANTPTKNLLIHLNLLAEGKPLNAAILLFGSNPQSYHRTAEVKCVSCHGNQYQRPFASHANYSGDLFEQADQAREFILSKINRQLGVRSESNTAPAVFEIPPDAIGEAIINAIVHRDYYSNASVEVRLFSDRLEIWNPGSLPGNMTLEMLREDHASVPYNPLLAESLYLARYIEKLGSGTQAMIHSCLNAGLPEPEFEQRGNSFVVTIWRDWLTDETIQSLELNERQQQLVVYLKSNKSITNSQYQELSGASRSTAKRDLEDLVEKTIISPKGKGRGRIYILVLKQH